MGSLANLSAPALEDERLRVLDASDAVGGTGIDVFDELVGLAARHAAVPIAAVNLIGEDRQWTLAGVGIATGDAPRATSLCDFAIGQVGATVIEDLREDSRFAAHPKVADGLRFYAGFPMLSREGLALGAFCVADVQPRVLSADQLASLEAAARAAAAQLDARRHAVSAREAGDRLQAIIDHAPDAFVSMDSRGRIVEWNLEAERLLGWSREEACGQTVRDLIVPPESRDAHAHGLGRFLDTGQSRLLNQPVEVSAVTRDGRRVPVELTIAATGDGAGNTFNASLRDISERRAAERALRSAETKFRGAFEHAPVGIGLASLEGNVWFEVNPALVSILGYPQEQLCGASFRRFTHPDDIDANDDGSKRLLSGELDVYKTEKRYLHRGGHVVWADLSVSLLRDDAGAPVCFISQIADRTARKLAEDGLRASERRLAEAQQLGRIGSYERDIEADAVTWSDQLCEIAGFPPGEYPASFGGFTALVHEDDRRRMTDSVQTACETGVSESEYRITRQDGDVRWIQGRRRTFTTDDGVARMTGTVQDITEQRAVQCALRDAEERFRSSFDDAPIGMALVSLEGRWTKVNTALCQITGYSAERLVELSFADITHPHDLQADLEYVRQMLAGERETYELQKRYLHAEGHIVWGQVNVSLVRDGAGAPMYFIRQTQDITERKDLERRLHDAARHDHLTGLLDRRGFEEQLQRQLDHAKRYKRGGAILLLDLDNFKAVNDTLGHKAGDEVLTDFAHLLGERLRKTDVIGRLGGDEFAVVLPEVCHKQAQHVITSLTSAINAESRMQNAGVARTAASIGLTMYDGLASMEDLLADADANMYAAKAATRDASSR